MGWLNNPKRAWEKKVLGVDRKRAARAREQEQQRQAYAAHQRAQEAQRQAQEAAAARQREQQAAAARAAAMQRQAAEEQRRQAEVRRQQQRQNITSQIRQLDGNISDVDRLIRQSKQLVSNLSQECHRLENQVAQERSLVDKFKRERGDPNRLRMLLVGETGHGKSTLANRLMGDESKFCEDGIFRVSDSLDSVTTDIQKEYGRVVVNGVCLDVSVIDTPGFGDSRGLDREHTVKLIEFLRGMERVHSIVWVRQASNPRLNSDEVKDLQELTRLLGKEFWKCVTLVLTRVDSGAQERQMERLRPQIQDKIRDVFNLSLEESPLPVIGIGMSADRYIPAVQELFQQIRVDTFLTCDSLHSPLDDLEREYEQQKEMVTGARTKDAELSRKRGTLTTQRGALQQQLGRV